MGLFTGIGDFFRGAFGEDDEEKRRRKQREAQEALARRSAPKPQMQTAQQQANNSRNSMIEPKKPNQPEQKLNQAQPTPTPQAPRVAPLPDQEFKGLNLVDEKNKTVFGRDVSSALDKVAPGNGKMKSYGTNAIVKTNKDKYVAAFDKLDSDRKKLLVNGLTQQANISNDQAAIASLKALQDTGRLEGSNWDFVEGNADKVRGGTARATLRGADFLLPGKNTFGLERLADELDPSKTGQAQYSSKGKTGEKIGSIEKGIIDTYMLMKANTAVSNATEKTAYAEKLSKLVKSDNPLARIFGKAVKEIPGSATGTAVSSLQTAGKGDKQNLTKDAAIGLGIDVLSPYASPVLRKLFGKGGDFVDDAAKELNVEKYGDDVERLVSRESRAAEQTKAQAEKEIEELQAWNQENVTRQMNGEAPLPKPGTPSPQEAYKAEQSAKRLANSEDGQLYEQGIDPNDPVDRVPAYIRDGTADKEIARSRERVTQIDDTLKRIYETENRRKLGQAIQQNPSFKDQLVKAYQDFHASATPDDIAKALADNPQYKELLRERGSLTGRIVEVDRLKQTADDLAKQASEQQAAQEARAATTATVQAEAAAKTAPPPSEVVQDAPVAGSPEIKANNAYRVEDVNPDGSKSGDSFTVEFPSENKIQKYRTAKELANSNNSGYVSSASDIVIKDIDGNEVRRMPYDEAVQRYGTSDPEELSHLLANGGAPKGNVSKIEAGSTRQSTNDILYGDTNTFVERDGLTAGQKYSPDRIWREKLARPGEELLNRGVSALQTTGNRLGRFFGRTATGFSRELGVDAATQTARMQMRGGIEMGKINREAIADLAGKLDDAQKADVWATIDTQQAGRAGKTVSVEDLSPEQLALRQKLVDIRDNATVENLRRGFITPEQAANGEYLNRDYSVLYDKESEVGKFEQGFRQELLGQYKGRKVVSEEMIQEAITDPAYLVAKKQAQSEAAWAMQDYGNYLASSGKVVDRAQPGFVQLPDSPLFGDAAGKFVQKNLAEDFTGFQYDMAITSAFNDMITAYDRWGVRQAKKALLTVFNPAVRLGNQVTNRGIFSQLAGINPVQFNIAMEAAKQEIKAGGQLYREAVQQGLTGVDITQAEFFAKRVADSAGGDKNIAKKALDWTQSSYSGADDQARIAAYMVKRQQGYDPVEAARQVQRGFQDYKSVGFFYDMAAKTPIIGNAFVRFAADSVRIAKNAALDHPLRTAGTIAAWSAFVNGMSVISGESELQGDNPASMAFNLVTGKSKSEAQKERENRFGAPKLPFTDISTAVQTPFGEVNVARFMPWYQLNDIPGANPIQRVLPISQSPVKLEDGKLALNAPAMGDPLLGQFVQIGIDEDFRGKSIRDPQNTDDKFRRDPLSTEDQAKNVLRFLFNNNAPLGREIDQTASAIKGVPDLYGKERSVPQALARDLGLKIEQQGEKQAQDRKSQNAYAEEKAQIEEELKSMSPDAQEAWRRLTGVDKMRQEVPNEFAPGETRNLKAEVYNFSEDKYKDYSAHPELYDLMVEKKQREFAKDGKPIPPEFDPRLSESFRKQLIQNKVAAPGDDAELDQRMYSTPEWDYYSDLKDQYKEAASKYYPKSDKEDFDDETVKHNDGKFPDKPPILKQYSAAYKNYTDGKTEKPAWNDTLTAAKEAYNKETLAWTNKARAARGLPAITWDVWNNPTFGFDETPSKSFGFGFGGGGGGGNKSVNTLTALTNFSGSVPRLKPIEAQAPPNIVALFQKLMAGKGGGKNKPKLGASSSGRG